MKRPELKRPEQCSDMKDIRVEIDALDEQVIALLGLRFQYVQAAAKFKTSEIGVRAPERFAALLEQRRQWAQQHRLNPDAIEKMYRDLVTHFIEEELKRWKQDGA